MSASLAIGAFPNPPAAACAGSWRGGRGAFGLAAGGLAVQALAVSRIVCCRAGKATVAVAPVKAATEWTSPTCRSSGARRGHRPARRGIDPARRGTAALAVAAREQRSCATPVAACRRANAARGARLRDRAADAVRDRRRALRRPRAGRARRRPVAGRAVVVPRVRADAASAQLGALSGWLAGIDLADADGKAAGHQPVTDGATPAARESVADLEHRAGRGGVARARPSACRRCWTTAAAARLQADVVAQRRRAACRSNGSGWWMRSKAAPTCRRSAMRGRRRSR